jgi:hypothetical protein
MTAINIKCEFGGCKQEARWECRKLFGTGGTIRTCDAHKPDPNSRPAALRHLPFFYEVKGIGS